MNCKKLIEVAMPVKEISAESVRDKTIRTGHISTLHKWWARRPLPISQAVVFASLIPDPLDENCPQQFKDAVTKLLAGSIYKPYEDIPYTSSFDPMEDNLRNRLLMFIGKYSKRFIQIEKSGVGTCPPKETLDNGSLIKWENKNNESILNIARKLIFVAHNANDATNARAANSATATAANASNTSASNDSAAASAGKSFSDVNRNNNTDAGSNRHSGLDPESYKSCDELLLEFDQFYSAIKSAEIDLYETPNRHQQTNEIIQKEENLHNAVESFLEKMPKVFDPFAGGGAIPLEAARLGCRTYANDLNPVAYIIEKGSVEFSQKFGKPIIYSAGIFIENYSEKEFEEQKELKNVFGDKVYINNRLAFDVEFYAKKLIEMVEKDIGIFYPIGKNGNRPIAYYWCKIAICSNPTCKAHVPMLRQFYLSKKPNKKIYLNPLIKNNVINFEIKSGSCELDGWNKRGNLKCPCCGAITDVKLIKKQNIDGLIKDRIIAVIEESSSGKSYRLPNNDELKVLLDLPDVFYPKEKMQRNSAGGDTFSWGVKEWGQMFSHRQILSMQTLVLKLNILKTKLKPTKSEYDRAIITYLSLWIGRIATVSTKFSVYNNILEIFQTCFGRQAISMVFDYPEGNPFTNVGGGNFINQLKLILEVIKFEGQNSFHTLCKNSSSGDQNQFESKSINATITDPPYYDAIAYADLSDFFYVWLKQTVSDIFPKNFSTPQTPKSEECTALKHHHNEKIDAAKLHFEKKLTQIFNSIEYQTSDIVSIMFAHQSTEAWTTLCNSVLDARMNITGSWAIDTEVDYALKNDKAFLASSVSVACRPAQRHGTGESKEVKIAIELKVKKEVEELYKLGFRGADLLTACFGPAVSEFGKYERVEKASGEEVTVEELLTWAKDAAFNAIVSDIPTDDFTRFYIGWLNLFGFSETDHDDVRRITQIGLHLDVNELLSNHLLIRNGNKQTLATFTFRAIENKRLGESKDSFTIDLVHKAMYLLKNNNRKSLLAFISEHAQNQEDIFWRVANSLKEVLPKGMEDQKQVSELLANKDNLIKDSKNIIQKFGEQQDMFNQ